MKGKDLQEFIYFFTHNKGLTREQQAKRDALLARDMSKRLISIGGKKRGSGKNNVELSALETSTFLSKFNEPMGLKYLTHDFDRGNDGSLETMSQLLSQVRSILGAKDYRIPSSLLALLDGFVFKGEWIDCYGQRHRSCFSNEEWVKWSEANGLHPINNPKYGKEINAFRSTIRLVPPSLTAICEHASEGLSLHIETKKLNAADFYTNTYCLSSVICRILKMMNAKAEDYPDVSIDYQRSSDAEGRLLRSIRIVQKGSFASKPLEDVKKRLENYPNAGDFGSIRKLLNGYCLWSVDNVWDGKACRWNLLKNPDQEEVETKERDEVAGFTHTLTFYTV